MKKQRSRNTKIEVTLRSKVHAQGLRYRIHRRPLKSMRREADMLFTVGKVAVFVDGCFWHGCPKHATWQKNNAEFWREKIETNMRRDRDTNEKLAETGWLAVRVWEHEDPQPGRGPSGLRSESAPESVGGLTRVRTASGNSRRTSGLQTGQPRAGASVIQNLDTRQATSAGPISTRAGSGLGLTPTFHIHLTAGLPTPR